jgi:preprotein translocase subunit SecE
MKESTSSRTTTKSEVKKRRFQLPKAVRVIFKYPLLVLSIIGFPFRPIGRYFRNSWRELKLVQWPNRKTSLQLTFAVIVFTTVLTVFITALDYGFEALVKRIIL